MAEQESVADGDDVTSHASSLGTDAPGAGQGELTGSELRDTGRVERVGAPRQLGGLCAEPVTQHLVRSGVHAAPAGLHTVPIPSDVSLRFRSR